MAKINVTFDVEWLDENQTLDEALREGIITSVVDHIKEETMEKITEEVNKKLSEVLENFLDKKLNELTDSLLNRKINIYDRWGDCKEENVEIMDILKRRLDTYLTEQVDENGKLSQAYGTKTRLEYCISKNINDDMMREIDKATSKCRQQLVAYMQKEVENKIGKNLAKIAGLDLGKADK